MKDGDRDLHQVFQAARAGERAAAPAFRRVLASRTGARRSLVPGLLAAGGAVALVGWLILNRPGRPDADLELARRVMAWRSPMDFLVPADSPGLLSFVPRIGQAPAGSPLQALDPGGVLGPTVFTRSPRS